MINIENTTAAERDIIANAMSPVMETILSAGRLLWDLQEEYEELPCEAIFLAFNYGRAMGERHARERKEAATRG